MELDRLTIKSQTALQEAHQQASARHHQQIEPEHVLYALLTDAEGVVFPLLHQLGVVPKQLRDHVDEALDTKPKVYAEGVQVGYATSGCWSPLLKRYIALAHLEARYAAPGTGLWMEVTVEHRRRQAAARVVPTPFFNPARKRA